MLIANKSPERTFGYLSAIESEEYGYFGGYLVVSNLGRPLEFHCTAPIQPNRAQQILYGPTLQPYLLGEQICGSLLGTAKLTPVVILTDCEAVLHARSRSAAPIVFIGGNNWGAIETAHEPPHGLMHSGYRMQFAVGFESDQSSVEDALSKLAQHVELAEPFGRIHEAIREAQRIGGSPTNSHDQAA